MTPDSQLQTKRRRLIILAIPVLLLLVSGGFWMSHRGSSTGSGSTESAQTPAEGANGDATAANSPASGDSAANSAGNGATSAASDSTATATTSATANGPLAGPPKAPGTPQANFGRGSGTTQTSAQTATQSGKARGEQATATQSGAVVGANVDAAHGTSTGSGATASSSEQTSRKAGFASSMSSAIANFFKQKGPLDGVSSGTATTTSDTKAADAAKSAANGAPSLGSAAPEINGKSVAQAPVAPAAPKEPEVVDSCVTLTFHHKATVGHGSEEACSHHRNLIKLRQTNYNAGSVCIRVNHTPVAFEAVKGKPGEFLIAAGPGPKAVITARFCAGNARCSEDCSVPKDDFVSAIGGDEPSGPVAQWDAGDAANKDGQVLAHVDGELKKEMDELDSDAKTESAETSVFPGWVAETETAPACGVKHAMNDR